MEFCYNTSFTLPKQSQRSRSILQDDGSSSLAWLWKEKLHLISEEIRYLANHKVVNILSENFIPGIPQFLQVSKKIVFRKGAWHLIKLIQQLHYIGRADRALWDLYMAFRYAEFPLRGVLRIIQRKVFLFLNDNICCASLVPSH